MRVHEGLNFSSLPLTLPSSLDRLMRALSARPLIRDLRQEVTLSAPVPRCNLSGPRPPSMAACALPFEPGVVVDVVIGHALSAPFGRDRPHQFDTLSPSVFGAACRAPAPFQDFRAPRHPFVSPFAPEWIADLYTLIARRQASATSTFRRAMKRCQSVWSTRPLKDALPAPRLRMISMPVASHSCPSPHRNRYFAILPL